MYPQSVFLIRQKKNIVYPCKPQLYYIKVGFQGSKFYRYVFVMHRPNSDAAELDVWSGTTVLTTSLGKTYFLAWRFILNENILF